MLGGRIAALVLGVAASSCAAKPKPSEPPSVWVPREDAGSLRVDLASSNIRSIHMPRAADEPAKARQE